MGWALGELQNVVIRLALEHGQDAALALEVVRRESGWDPDAVGDQGRAVGLWQWHLLSWCYVRRVMRVDGADLRRDPVEATRAAMYAWRVMGLTRWWSTYAPAREALYGAGAIRGL